MARVIAYTRVSSEEQTRGSSLGDQSERIQQWLTDNGHVLVASYSEHGSGGSTKNRNEFTRLMSDLEALRPSILIVDASDRFTRNALDGGKWVSHLTDLGVRLAVIEHDEGRVLDMSVYADRSYVTNAFMIADGERERMSQRQKKRYSKATTKVNRPPWGVLLEPGDRARRRLVPDPERAPVIAEIDRRILSGQSIATVVDWLTAYHPGSWTSRTALAQMLKDKSSSYVVSGVRSADTQAQLREMFAARRHIFGRDRKRRSNAMDVVDPIEALLRDISGEAPLERPSLRDHMLAGILACGKCVESGVEPSKALMAGYYAHGNAHPYALSCVGTRGKVRLHGRWSIGVVRVIPLLYTKLIKLRNDEVADKVLERWATEPVAPRAASEREALERKLAGMDEKEASLEAQVSAAFRLMASGKASLIAEAERQIDRHHANRLALSAERASLQSRLADMPAPRVRRLSAIDRDELRINAEELLTGYQVDPATGTQWVDVDVRAVLAKWVRLIGPPVVNRDTMGRYGVPSLTWPFLDQILPEEAPDFIAP